MTMLSRAVLREVLSGATLGTLLFTFLLFLQRLGRLFEILVRSSAPVSSAGYLLILALPSILAFTIPLGVLAGVLMALSRMSTDGEVLAMRAAGIRGQVLLRPVLGFGVVATLIAGYSSLVLGPQSVRESVRVLNRVIAEQITAEIQPRVFEEQFPNVVLYVGDVLQTQPVRWRQMFLADLTPSPERKWGAGEKASGPIITLAEEVIAVPDPKNNRIQLTLFRGSSHQAGQNPEEYYSTTYPYGEQVIDAPAPATRRAKEFTDAPTRELFFAARQDIEARIELHRRFALPAACLVLCLLAIPVGVSSRKSGKSSALIVTVVLAFLYYMGLISLIGLAQQNRIPAALAVWLPNLVFGGVGLFLAARMEKPRGYDLLGALQTGLRALYGALRYGVERGNLASRRSIRNIRFFWLPQILDTYVVNSFLFYFGVLLAAFVGMVEVFTFFELLGDIVRNQIPLSKVLSYLFFLTPKLIYDSAPLAVLVATLVTFGILSRHNEVIALKACGVSIHRITAPVVATCVLLSAALFAFDFSVAPSANRIQDALRNEIKGRPPQTYLNPDRKWIMGENNKIYYYRFFDPDERVMGELNLYEIDPHVFRLKRHIRAERARWEPSLKTWVFFNGWVRQVDGVSNTFTSFVSATFPEVIEPPQYFLKEVKTDSQMNYQELAAYIRELQQSGFQTVRLRVQYQKKFAGPLFVLIMALLGAPFAFLAGSRSVTAGVAASFGIAVAYLVINKLFEQFGNVNQLPPVMAAWSPHVIFTLSGVYLFTRVRT